MQNIIRVIFLFIVVSSFSVCIAQEIEDPEKMDEVEEMEEEKHFIALAFGYTYIPKGAALDASGQEGILVPSIGIDYFHILDRRWELGVMIDFELDHYLIFEKKLERENALIVTLMGTHKLRNWHIQGGLGVEFEQNEHLFIWRLGLERPFLLGNRWVLAPAVYYDIKEGYDTWSISLSIGRGF